MGVNKNMIGEDFSPEATNLLESKRSLGYSVEEAVADLVDNSIGAKAENISFYFIWNDGNPKFILLDDGHGMSNDNLEFTNSFRLATKNPLTQREYPDLGRFGLGMKTATLSQCRELIVISKRSDCEINIRSLDLDFIKDLNNSWKLKYVNKVDCLGFDDIIINKGFGTAIIWNKWDRAPKDEKHFNELIDKVSNYLSVIFHRFLEKGLNIYASSIPIIPCGPIPSGDGAMIHSIKKLEENDKVVQTAYLLQHPSKWKEDYESTFAFNSFRLFEGFERQQGIYIYRCDRLLNPMGGWLGILKRGNSAKLARVTIDYPNNSDTLWNLDITKTNATIPYEFKKEIEEFVIKTKNASNNKITRGKRKVRESLSSYTDSLIWREEKNRLVNSIKYKVNIDHELFKTLIEKNKIDRKVLSTILSIVSETLPISKIINNNEKDSNIHDRSEFKNELNKEELQIAKYLFHEYLKVSTRFQAISKILSIEPFCFFEEQIKLYLDE